MKVGWEGGEDCFRRAFKQQFGTTPQGYLIGILDMKTASKKEGKDGGPGTTAKAGGKRKSARLESLTLVSVEYRTGTETRLKYRHLSGRKQGDFLRRKVGELNSRQRVAPSPGVSVPVRYSIGTTFLWEHQYLIVRKQEELTDQDKDDLALMFAIVLELELFRRFNGQFYRLFEKGISMLQKTRYKRRRTHTLEKALELDLYARMLKHPLYQQKSKGRPTGPKELSRLKRAA